MSERLRERLGYLNSELDDLREIQRSISPSRRASRSPRPLKCEDFSAVVVSSSSQTSNAPSVTHNSRPDIAPWPVPATSSLLGKGTNPKGPSTISTGTQASSTLSEDSGKLLAMLRVAATSNPGVTRGREFELRRKIENLEQTIAEYEKQRYNSTVGTFSEYREYVAERERTLEVEYSNKIISLSEEVLNAKKDFEARMKSFQALQEQFEHEKEQALDNLRQEHQKEIEMLERRVGESKLLNLEQKYILEIRRLEDERKSLRTEKERLSETFDMKLRRAQSLYETQLTAAKTLYTKELEALRSHEDHLKEELAARHEEFRDRVQELKLQARQSREEVSACKSEITLLQKKLKQKESEVESITKELENVRNELRGFMRKLRDVDIRYAKCSEDLDRKETELNQKAELLEAAEDTRSRLESTIRKLQVEVKGLKNKVEFLEIERDNLQCQSESQAHLAQSQVQALEAVLESVTKEKETAKEHYEKMLEQERHDAEVREGSLRKELCSKFTELEDQYNALKDYVDESGAFGPESGRILEEVEVLRAQKNYLEDEVVNLHAQLAEDKQKLSGTDQKSFGYVSDVSRAVDSIHKNVQGSSHAGDSSIFDSAVNSFKSELQQRLKESSYTPSSELHNVLIKLVQVEKDVQTIIVEKDEAKSKLARLEDENRKLKEATSGGDQQREELSRMKDKYEKVVEELEHERNRFNQLQEELQEKESVVAEANEYRAQIGQLETRLTKQDAESRKKDKAMSELNENLRETDQKNRILIQLIQYQQKAPVDDVVNDLLSEIGTNADVLSEEELHDMFEKYDKLKKKPEKPQTRHIETSTRPEVREMALQTNIEIKTPPSQSEQLQKEIVGMLANLMNGKADQYSDLLQLKNILISATESASSSDETPESPDMPQMGQKATNKFHNLVSQMSERRAKRSKPGTSKEEFSERDSRKDEKSEIPRSRSPSVLSRLRERTSPPKASHSSPCMEQSLSSNKSFVYSSDTDRSADSKRKRASRTDGSRPAWKF